MTELEIEINKSIDDIIVRLLNVLESNASPQNKMDQLQAAGVQLSSAVEFWNYKLEKLRNGV
jgi:hypothetical protein